MSRTPSTFKQRDVARVIRAVRQAGEENARVEIERDGKIIIVIGKSAEQDSVPPDQIVL